MSCKTKIRMKRKRRPDCRMTRFDIQVDISDMDIGEIEKESQIRVKNDKEKLSNKINQIRNVSSLIELKKELYSDLWEGEGL